MVPCMVTIGFLMSDHLGKNKMVVIAFMGNEYEKSFHAINTALNALIFKKRADKSGLFVIFAPNI